MDQYNQVYNTWFWILFKFCVQASMLNVLSFINQTKPMTGQMVVQWYHHQTHMGRSQIHVLRPPYTCQAHKHTNTVRLQRDVVIRVYLKSPSPCQAYGLAETRVNYGMKNLLGCLSLSLPLREKQTNKTPKPMKRLLPTPDMEGKSLKNLFKDTQHM